MPMIQTDSQHYTDIADAIRDQNGTQDVYYPADMAAAIRSLPNGDVDDVQVNGTSVVVNKVAKITSYKPISQSDYNNLPASKTSDGIAYYITDADSAIASFISGTAAPDSTFGMSGNIYIQTNSGGTVIENIYFKVNTTWIPMITNGNTVGW